MNGITGSSSTIFAGQNYRIPTDLTNFSAEETNGGQATLVADNNRLAQLRAAQDAATAQQTSDIDASSDVPFYLNRNSGPSFVQGPSDPGGFLADQINSGALLRDVVPALAPADRAAYLQNLTGGAVVGPVPEPPPFNPAFSLFAAFVGGPIAGLPLATTIALGGSPQQQLAAQDAGVALFGIGASLAGAAIAPRVAFSVEAGGFVPVSGESIPPEPLSPTSIASRSGVLIEATPGQTTTVLGSFDRDLNNIINQQLNYPKTTDFGPKPGGFNLLNVPVVIYNRAPDQFFTNYNQPFLDAALARGDPIRLATPPSLDVTRYADGSPTGFGRELEYLQQLGRYYNPQTEQIAPVK